MRQRLERLAAVGHGASLAKVFVHGGLEVEVLVRAELARIEHLSAKPDAVDGPVDAVERSGAQHLGRLLWIPMRLAELHAGQDPEVLELGPAALYGVEIALDVHAVLALVDQGP